MRSKRILLVLMFFMMMTCISYAKQGASEQPVTFDDIIARLTKQLELSDQQTEAIKPIIAHYIEEEKKLKLQEKRDLSKILTSDQLYAWVVLQEEAAKEKKKHKL